MRTWIRILLFSALGCLVLAIGGAWLHKFGIAPFRISNILVLLSFLISIIVAILSIGTLFVRVLRKQSFGLFTLLFAFLICFGLAGYAAILFNKSASVPVIYDIATNLDDPPMFSEIAMARRGTSSNKLALTATDDVSLREATRRGNLEAYQDVQSLDVETSQSFTHSAALELVEERGWDLVSQDAAIGRIEAIAETFWFGFKDDVAIRIRINEETGQTTVDMRSVSRIGLSDLGTNAQRIQRFLADLQNKLGSNQSSESP